jgi:hypothetical protein
MLGSKMHLTVSFRLRLSPFQCLIICAFICVACAKPPFQDCEARVYAIANGSLSSDVARNNPLFYAGYAPELKPDYPCDLYVTISYEG